MNQPEYILKNDTKIVTHRTLDSTQGLCVSSQYIAARKSGAKATIFGVVGGHGGDVYWARHEDGSEAVYCFTEFEFDTPEKSDAPLRPD